MSDTPPQCPSHYPEPADDGAGPLVCIQDEGHTGPHRDGLGREWAPRGEPDHDPLETMVSVAEDLSTVSLWVDGYEVPLACDPGVAEAHVDILRRIQAACGQAIRLIRSPQARQVFAQAPGGPPH